jgi:general secretion pathway protein L
LALQSSAGFEIREDGASAVLLKTSLGGARVEAKESFAFQSGLPSEEKAKAASDFLKSFLKRHGGSSASIYVVVPRQWALNRIVEAPAVIKENLREALGYEMDKYVPFPVASVWYDYGILSEDEENIRILLTVLKKDEVLPFFEEHGGLGRSAAGLETVSSALSNAFLELEGPLWEGPSFLIHQGKGRIEICILEGARLVFSRSVAIPGDDEGCVPLILHEVKRAFEAIGAPETGIRALCAGEACNAVKELKEKGEISDFKVAGENKAAIDPEMLPAYGAALRGIKKVPLEVNLLPFELRKKASKAPFYVMYLLAFLVAVSACAWGTGHVLRQRAELKQLNEQAKALASEADAVQRIRSEIVALETRIRYLEDFRTKRGAVIALLKELTERIPKSAWISNLNFSEKGVEIEGYADSASELIPLLDKSPMFKDVGFLSSITKAQGKERFRIGLKQVPEGAGGRGG